MQKGSYIWDFTVKTAWSYDGKTDEGEEENYTVTSPTFDLAWTKVKKIALSSTRKFSEELEEGGEELKKYTHYPVRVELTQVERGNWIDG